MKGFLLFSIGCLSAYIGLAQPVINSFTPTSGAIGATVTINGTNFNTTPTNNVVFFGAVRAPVSTASATSLTVTVPIGTTFDPITVTTLNNNLTAYSKQPFVVTFSGAGSGFTPSSFDVSVDFATGIWPYAISNIDLDNDGKPDFAVPNYTPNTFSILKNTGGSGTLSYAPHIDIATGVKADAVTSGDIDGDGKPDIAITNWASDMVSVYRNTSTTGIISFAPKIDFNTGMAPEGVCIGDIDGDGKPDLLVTEINSFAVSVFRNTSSVGTISFAPKVSFATGFNPDAVIIRDLDGDGKPDLGISVNGANKVCIFRNTSIVGAISFDPRIDLIAGIRPFNIAVGDLDGDGKPDLVTPNNGSSNASVFRNTSTPGTISFDPAIVYAVGNFPQKIAIGDLDGDNKLDMAITNSSGGGSIVSLYKNISSPGSIVFAPKVDYTIGFGPTALTLGDMDGDGLPDIAATSTISYNVSILRNTVVCTTASITTQPADNSICAGANATFSITATNVASYQWQVDDGSGWTNISNNAIYSGATTNILTITAATVSMNSYKYRCVIANSCGTINSSAALLTVNTASAPTVSISATASTICQGSPVTFTAVPVNGGSAPVFQWKKNGINVGFNSNTYTDNTINNTDIINCMLTSNSLCASPNTAVSNDIIMTVTLPLTPTISISASANNICFGTAVTFTAIATNSGVTPSYQWIKNGINVGSNIANYTDNTLTNADIIKCTLTSSLTCVTTPSATSNQVLMIVTPSVTPSISITASANNICPGTLVIFSAITTDGGPGPVYQWKKNGIVVGSNSATYNDNSIINGDIVTCILTSNLVVACLTTTTATSNVITMSLRTLPGPVDLGTDKTGCTGTPVTLAPQGVYISYLWQDGSTNPTLIATLPGLYSLRATDACGNTSTDDVQVSLNPLPANFLPPDTSVCSYEHIVLKTSATFNQYMWNTNAVTSSITINTTGLYWLQVTDNNNCTGRDSITVYPKNCLKGFYMPTAFTPNGDTKNDFCKPMLFGTVKQYEFKVYNRYGELLFSTKDPSKGWDGELRGKPQNSGVFVWTCVYQIDGQMVNSERGTVMLIR